MALDAARTWMRDSEDMRHRREQAPDGWAEETEDGDGTEGVESPEAEPDDERQPSPDFPEVPSRDIGTSGTRDVDPPPNTGRHSREVPDPPS